MNSSYPKNKRGNQNTILLQSQNLNLHKSLQYPLNIDNSIFFPLSEKAILFCEISLHVSQHIFEGGIAFGEQ